MEKKHEINEERKDIKVVKQEKNYIEEIKNLNIYNLIKSDFIMDQRDALNLLIQYFNDEDLLIKKYEILIKISEEIFPLLFNTTPTPLSDEKNLKDIELFVVAGKFLLQFLFDKEYLLDFSSFDNSDNISKKFPCLFLYNKSEIISINELDNKRYKLLQYDILKKYKKELSDLYIKYFINPMIIFDTNFEIQFIIFEMLKYLYFLCKETGSINEILKYISEVLTNLSLFEKQSEYEKIKKSKEFGYFLLLHENNFKSIDSSLTISPKNEYDIYTTKFNIAKDIVNKAFYIKKEIPQGKKFELHENMNKRDSILYIEFFVEDNKEISLTIYKKNEKEKEFEQIGFNNIIKTVKISVDNEKEEKYKVAKVIVLNCANNEENTYKMNYINQFKIIFDNYDSWFTKRTLHYSISIFEKI